MSRQEQTLQQFKSKSFDLAWDHGKKFRRSG